MNVLIIIGLILLYGFVGFFVDCLANSFDPYTEDFCAIDVIVILLWPLALIAILIYAIFSSLYDMRRSLADKLRDIRHSLTAKIRKARKEDK